MMVCKPSDVSFPLPCHSPLCRGPNEGSVAVQAPHVHQNVWPLEKEVDNGSVILLHGDDERRVTVGVADVWVGLLPLKDIPELVLPATEGGHQESRAGGLTLSLLEERER